MAARGTGISNSAADRAGNIFRDWIQAKPRPRLRDMPAEESTKILNAIMVIEDYRKLHAEPMTRVTMGIRSMVKTVRGNDLIRPGQRFKRFDRILAKLIRYPSMRLSQMEDIGGCRLILLNVSEVYAVLARIRHNWPENARVSDYIADPKSDGYRGIHVIHQRGGRLVEVQLRTQGQHEWAEAIELSSPRVGFNLKDGGGPDDLREYFKAAADRIARQEAGLGPDPALEAGFATLRAQVVHYFQQANS